MTWGQIKKDLQIYGQRLFYSNNSIWCSFTPCVDVVIAAAAADFPGLPNRLAAAPADLVQSCIPAEYKLVI